ncbi:MAG: hypothetical protein ACKPCM_18765 [Pseudanabaena sp.]
MSKPKSPRALPNDVAEEILGLTTSSKAMLLLEIADEVNEKLPEFPALNLSATSTQWLKALSIIESLQLIQSLSQAMLLEITE